MNIDELEAKLSRRTGSPLFARLADEYLAVGRINEAKEMCLSGLQRFPDYLTGHIVLARCFEAEQDYTAAIHSVEEALRVSPDASLPQSLLAEYKIRLLRKPTVIDGIDDHEKPSMAHIVSPTEVEVREDIPPHDLTPTPDEIAMDVAAEPAPTEQRDEMPAATATGILETAGEELHATEEITPDHDSLTSNLPESGDMSAIENVSREVAGDSIPDGTALDRFLYGNGSDVEGNEDKAAAAEDLREPESAELAEALPLESSDVPTISVQTQEEGNSSSEIPAEIPEEEIRQETNVEGTLSTVEMTPPATHDEPPSAFGSEGRIVSKTLAEIYAMQGAYSEAILTYRMLQEMRPEFREEYEKRIRELEPKVQAKTAS